MYGLPKNVRVLSVHLSVCSPYVVSLGDFAYYVFG